MSKTAITASDVALFREETGFPVMVCKIALEAADGDHDEARKLIRLRYKPKMSVADFREAVSRP